MVSLTPVFSDKDLKQSRNQSEALNRCLAPIRSRSWLCLCMPFAQREIRAATVKERIVIFSQLLSLVEVGTKTSNEIYKTCHGFHE